MKRFPSKARRVRAPGGTAPVWAVVLTAAAVIGYFLPDHLSPGREAGSAPVFALFVPERPASSAPTGFAIAPRAMPVCAAGRRINCVVDGDTLWLDGEKIRIESIDAPEIRGNCPRESNLAQQSTRRLSQLASGQPLRLQRNGTDRYGRTLARISSPDGDLGSVLIQEGLAQRWAGRKAQWCA